MMQGPIRFKKGHSVLPSNILQVVYVQSCFSWICVFAPKGNIVHHPVHRYIRAFHGDKHEECSLLDVMSSSLVMAPIIRAGRSGGTAICSETLAEKGEPFLSKRL